MPTSLVIRSPLLFTAAALLCLSLLPSPGALAHETSQKVADPGFRPDNEYAQTFIEALETASIAVYPTLVRRASRTAVSFESRQQIVEMLGEQDFTAVVARGKRLDLGPLRGSSQWNVFTDDMEQIAKELTRRTPTEDFLLVMEFLLPVNDQSIFGVHVYVFNQQGQSVFSFLLNAHHQSFVDAQLATDDSTEEARRSMLHRATTLGIAALRAQIEEAKICITHTEHTEVVNQSGVIDDFESGVALGEDRFGVPIGFVSFNDSNSKIGATTTDEYPLLPPKVSKNSVLRIDADVAGWAAVAHIFESPELDRWLAYDWSDFDEMSFWFYGRGSGISMFVHVLDNRHKCSTRDDAERFVFAFADDFMGWERVTIRFSDMVRKDVGIGAPDDGLGLSSVHGWAIGALNTNGPATFYIDDIVLRRPPPAVTDYPINEIPMYGGRRKTTFQKNADAKYIEMATSGGRSRPEAAEIAAASGWRSYYDNDPSTAIKRFNQAWLLDPENQLSLWGFAVVSADRRQYDDAIRFFKMAIEKGPENPDLKRDYEFALKRMQKTK